MENEIITVITGKRVPHPKETDEGLFWVEGTVEKKLDGRDFMEPSYFFRAKMHIEASELGIDGSRIIKVWIYTRVMNQNVDFIICDKHGASRRRDKSAMRLLKQILEYLEKIPSYEE